MKIKNIKQNRILLLSLFIIIGFSSSAQNWNLLQEGKQWNHVSKIYSYSNNIHKYIISHTTAIKFMNDTLINDTLYKKAYSSIGVDERFLVWDLLGFSRENNQGLYFRNLSNNEEQIYYYNLQVGDFFYAKNPYVPTDSFPAYVSEIDSVLISGKYKKRYCLKGPMLENGREDWIVGVGSLSGIIYPFLHEMK